MTEIIRELTPEQEAKLPEYRDKWIAIGLNCDPADRPLAEEGIRQAYRDAGKDEPKTIIWCDSPYAAAKARQDAVGGNTTDGIWEAGYGQHDASWLAFYDFLKNECGLVEETKPLEGLFKIAVSAGWWWPHKESCWVSERPVCVTLDDQGRLHGEERAAILFRDGWGIWAWHGVEVPKLVIEEPEKITTKMISEETNAEIRRVMMERFGWEKYLLETNATPVHTDDYGSLYDIELPNGEHQRFIHVVNGTVEADGSRHKFIIPVRPDVQTALEGVASTYRVRGEDGELHELSVEEYKKLRVRT